ncbi:carbon starvation protein [Bifidobacterium sp. ESL0682]|uniref:carbon starvation protein n=1 Tax=Bifidobacterium sp. ESL0682 TaxID=2983212 RepID=UPI0023F72D72|nr:carbon starvation protein [Bifidobacterium sp. ESL0682]WEV42607.1 carbon starvation protein [Bifidobacterium sp. ESL0682]
MYEKMNLMKLSEHSRGLLYAFMSAACLIWLVQSSSEAFKSGTFFTWPNLIFVCCMVVIIGYGMYAAFQSWATTDKADNQKKNTEE